MSRGADTFEEQIVDTFTYDEFQQFTDIVENASGTDYMPVSDASDGLPYDPDTLTDKLDDWSELGVVELDNGEYRVTKDGHIAFGLYGEEDESFFDPGNMATPDIDIDHLYDHLSAAAGRGTVLESRLDPPSENGDRTESAIPEDTSGPAYVITQYIAEHGETEKAELWDALDVSDRTITRTLFDLEDNGIIDENGSATYDVPDEIRDALNQRTDTDTAYDVPAGWTDLLNAAMDNVYSNSDDTTETDNTAAVLAGKVEKPADTEILLTLIDTLQDGGTISDAVERSGYSHTMVNTRYEWLEGAGLVSKDGKKRWVTYTVHDGAEQVIDDILSDDTVSEDTYDDIAHETSSTAEGLTENQQIIRSYVAEHGQVSKDMLQDDLDLSNREIGQNLRYLRESGELEATGDRYRVPGTSTDGLDDTAAEWDDIDVDGLREVLQNSLTRQLFEDGTELLTAPDGSKKQVVRELDLSQTAVDNHYARLADTGVFERSGPTNDPTYEINDAAKALYDTVRSEGWEEAMDTLHDHSSYPAAFDSREEWDTFLTFVETFRKDGSVKQAEASMDISYLTAKRRYDTFEDRGFFDQEGWATSLEYHVNDDAIADFADAVERETLPSMIAAAVETAEDVDTYLTVQKEKDTVMWEMEEIPEELDIVPQWEELLGFGYAAADDSYWKGAEDEIGLTRGSLKRRLETLEEKGVVQEDSDRGTFVFDKSLKPVFDRYRDDGKIFFDPDQLAFDDLDQATLFDTVMDEYDHLADVFDDETELEYLLEFAEVGTQTRRGIRTVAREQDIDQSEVQEYYDTLEEKGVLDRSSTSQQLIFDETVKDLLETYADLDDHPNGALQFRDIDALRENREMMQELEETEEPDQGMTDHAAAFTDYSTMKDEMDADGPSRADDRYSQDQDHAQDNPPLSESNPAELVDRTRFGDISGQDLETLEAALEGAVTDADRSDIDSFTATTNQWFESNDLNLYLSSPRNRESSYVMLPVETDGPMHIEKEEYDRFMDQHTDLTVDDDHLLLFDYDAAEVSSFGLTPARDILGTLPV